MDQEIQFCTTVGGVRLAYAKVGQGPPLVKVANWLNHLEYDWQSPIWRPWLEGLARYHTLYRYDERGCGLSDWDAVVQFLNQLLSGVRTTGTETQSGTPDSFERLGRVR